MLAITSRSVAAESDMHHCQVHNSKLAFSAFGLHHQLPVNMVQSPVSEGNDDFLAQRVNSSSD